MSLVLVSAFYDLGRDRWQHYSRSAQEYCEAFQYYQHLPYPLMLFLDERHLDKIKPWPLLTVIPINDEWLKQHSSIWCMSAREKEILASSNHRALVAHRAHCPETYCAKYNLINHAKVDFVIQALTLAPTASHLAWTDFGYFWGGKRVPGVHWPERPLDLNYFPSERITYGILRPPTPLDRNIRYTLQEAPEIMVGSFFVGGREALLHYQQLFQRELATFQEQGYADDDQHLALRCYWQEPELFNLVVLPRWHTHYTVFQTST